MNSRTVALTPSEVGAVFILFTENHLVLSLSVNVDMFYSSNVLACNLNLGRRCKAKMGTNCTVIQVVNF